MSLPEDSGIVNLIDGGEWLEQSKLIGNEVLDFDTLFLRIFKPTDSELQEGGDAQSCSSNKVPRLADSLANSSEPMSRAKTQNLDLASMPPPTIVLSSKRKSSKLNSAKAEL